MSSIENNSIPDKPVTADRVVRTVCSPNCSGTCGINAFIKDEKILKIEPAAFPDPGFERICLKGIAMAMQRIHHPDRLTHPLVRVGERGEDRWQQISWDEALDKIASQLKEATSTHGPEANAWMTMSGNYGFKATTAPERIANCLGGTTLSHGGMMGDLSCAMGYIPVLGVGSFCNDLADLKQAKYILIFGRNPADTDHSEMRFLFDVMDAGAKVVVVDPRFSRTATKADEWVSPRPGTDAALVLGMINVIIEQQLYDSDYLRRFSNAPFLVREDNKQLLRAYDLNTQANNDYMVWDEKQGKPAAIAAPAPGVSSPHTNQSPADIQPALSGEYTLQLANGNELVCRPGFDLMVEAWAEYTPQHAAAICEVPEQQLRRIAMEYANADPAWMWVGAGPQRYHQGHLTHRAYVTLGALCGNIGKAYAGVNCLDGAHMRLTFNPPEEWVAPNGKRGRNLPGVHMLNIISQGEPYPIKNLWLTSYGFGSQSPNFDRFIKQALPNLDLFVVTEQVMTPAARYADIVLPCVSYYEEEMDLVAGGEHWYLQLRQRAIPPVGESRNDYEIFQALAQKMDCGDDWLMSNEEVCRFVMTNHHDPVIRNIEFDELKREGVARVEIERPHVPFANRQFPTPSGRIELYTEQLLKFDEAMLCYREPLESARSALADKYPLVMLSPKHVHSAHSTHTQLPWIREQLPEPALEVHPADAKIRDIKEGDRLRVFNDRGEFIIRAVISEAVKPGMVSVPQGFWHGDFIAGHPSHLGHIVRNETQEAIIETNYPVWDILVQVEKT